MPQPIETAAWRTLAALARTPRREWQPPLLAAAGVMLDLSRQHLDQEVGEALLALAREMQVETARGALFAGERVNPTEGRAALHWLCRADQGDVPPALQLQADEMVAQRERMLDFAERVRRGAARGIADRAFHDVVVIGIGGSALGPAMAVEALSRFADGPRIRFVTNVDGADLTDTLARCDAQRTLFVTISKTFTTDETVTNTASAHAWLRERLGDEAFAVQSAAVTSHPDEALRQGFSRERIFAFPESVGGRFSLWSSVGLPVALACGRSSFLELLAGARDMDAHFRSAPASLNLPLQLALTGIWNRNFQAAAAHALLPYARRLGGLPRHLQQLEMESNGKSVDVQGNPIGYATAPIVFGEAGTDGQHSFYQWLHQGSDRVSADIVVIAEAESALRAQHAKLLANAAAQADCLWQGYRPADGTAAGPYRRHDGGRPVGLIEIVRLDARHLGALVALYEHKVFCQGVLWHVNPFDQFGVERGKAMARERLAGVAIPPADGESIIARLRQRAGTA